MGVSGGFSLDGPSYVELLTVLGERLSARGVEVELYVVGGSAIAMTYSSSRRTKDVDALFQGREVVIEEAERIAAERRDLPDDWLNDTVASVMPPVADPSPREVVVRPGVRVSVASPEYLLAMKVMTSRESDTDLDDAAFLARHAGIETAEEIGDLVRRYFPASGLLDARWEVFEEVIDRVDHLEPEDRLVPPPIPSMTSAMTPSRGSCGHWMPLSHRHCSLSPRHRGQHR